MINIKYKQITKNVADAITRTLGLRGTVVATLPTSDVPTPSQAPIRPYAFNAFLKVIEGDKKLYEIEWMDSKGQEHVTEAIGIDMKQALATVLRSRQAYWFESVSEWLLSLTYGSFLVLFTFALMSDQPMTNAAITLGVYVVGFFAVRRYFRNVNLKY